MASTSDSANFYFFYRHLIVQFWKGLLVFRVSISHIKGPCMASKYQALHIDQLLCNWTSNDEIYLSIIRYYPVAYSAYHQYPYISRYCNVDTILRWVMNFEIGFRLHSLSRNHNVSIQEKIDHKEHIHKSYDQALSLSLCLCYITKTRKFRHWHEYCINYSQLEVFSHLSVLLVIISDFI